MKKKFLSLMMAAAVVATTSVSAFAADETTDVTVTKNGVEQNVDITGNIADSNDKVVEGTITVTVPTAMAFTINSTGQLENAKITISNKSDSKVEVIAKGFVDSTPNSSIVVKKNNDLENADDQPGKKNISLTLTTGQNSVGLLSTASGTGLYNIESKADITSEQDTSLGVILAKKDLDLNLTCETQKANSGLYTPPSAPMKDSFTLKLKIQKATR